MKSLTDLALKTAQLPSLPELVNDLQILIDQDKEINVIAELLATDASLSARVIELANTAFYGNQNVTKIFDAIHLIGLSKLLLMVRTAYTIEILKSVDGARIDMRKFWIKSYTAALISQRLGNRIHYPQADSLYTSGLLMYIGELIYSLLPPHIQLDKMDPFELAAAQLSLWQFPSFIVESIRYTASPVLTADQFALPAAVVHITDSVINKEQVNPDEEAMLLTQLTEAEIDNIYNEVKSLGVSGKKPLN
ncbi:MAG: HDOD domain-containing protein [Gammaproteobacteria bacterium]|nr:HDOD domain-containing protein [Gammaproteobacteria bacterium]